MTIKEIAKLANVSITTVSKVINNKDDNISPETRSRVLKIVKEYNYTPYGTVKNLSTTRTFLLAVLLKNTSQSNQIFTGVLRAAHERGYSVLFYDSEDSLEQELKHITSCCQNKIDGVLWEPVGKESIENARYLTEAQIEICYINSTVTEEALRIDYQKLGFLCTQKLIEYRHSKIGCLLKKDSSRSAQLLEGFKRCLFDHQLSYQDTMVLDSSDPSCMQKIISCGFTGIISSHYTSALTLYEQFINVHYNIPTDLSIISLKGNVQRMADFPPISCYEIAFQEFGYQLCSFLIEKCESSEAEFSFSQENIFTNETYTLNHERSLDLPYNFQSKKIIVVGSINEDITFNVDNLPQPGKTIMINNVSVSLGGKGANQAIAAARLGKETTLCGKIGNDMESNFILDILKRENVSTAGVHRMNNSQTGKAYIYLQRDGEGTISILPGSNTHLTQEDMTAQEYLFKNSSFCLLASEIPIPTIIEATRLARKYHAKTIFKPATLRSFPEEMFSLVDILIPNKKEAALLAPDCTSVENQADYFFQKGIPTVIITLGQDGCYLKTVSESRYYPASKFQPIDTTGGADAFISALAVYLSDGYSLDKSIRIAHYAAGFCISRQGVVSGLVDRNTLQAQICRVEPELLHAGDC